jgi:hypothetical protein
VPRAIPVPVRQAALSLQQAGLPARDIAARLDLVPRTVQRLLRAAAGPRACGPAYHRCGQGQRRHDEAVRLSALRLREEHPGWGAGYLRLRLARLHPDSVVSARRITSLTG